MWFEAAADLVGSVLPAMDDVDVATAAEVELASVAERLRSGVTATDRVILGRSDTGAWSRV